MYQVPNKPNIVESVKVQDKAAAQPCAYTHPHTAVLRNHMTNAASTKCPARALVCAGLQMRAISAAQAHCPSIPGSVL